MRNLLCFAFALSSATLAACTSSPPEMSMGGGGGGGGGGQAAGTVLVGTLEFSPITDSLDKFQLASLTDGHQPAPPLEVLDEATLGTGDCSMVVLPSGEQFGATGWVFAAPAGQTFTHVSVVAPVTLDPRADTSTTSIQALLLTQDTTLELGSLGDAAAAPATQSDIDAAVAGLDQFAIAFGIDNPDYSDDLERIFPQALRQCPGAAAPFSISAQVE